METIYLKIVLAIIFALAVIAKFTGKTKSTFEKAGYSPQIMYLIATAECILSIALFTIFELWATLGLLAILAGAFYTLFRQKEKPVKYIMAIIAFIFLLILLYLIIS